MIRAGVSLTMATLGAVLLLAQGCTGNRQSVFGEWHFDEGHSKLPDEAPVPTGVPAWILILKEDGSFKMTGLHASGLFIMEKHEVHLKPFREDGGDLLLALEHGLDKYTDSTASTIVLLRKSNPDRLEWHPKADVTSSYWYSFVRR